MMDIRDVIFDEIIKARSVRIVDDVSWDSEAQRYVGSFLWHGIPTTYRCLQAIGIWAKEIAKSKTELGAVVGIRSSGVSWATSISLQTQLPLIALRVSPHKYGPWNEELRLYAGCKVLVVDNYCGSGDTVTKAVDLIETENLGIADILVVESAGQYNNPLISSVIVTSQKLAHLLSNDYFQTQWVELIERYLHNPQTWLDDANWVLSVKEMLTGVV